MSTALHPPTTVSTARLLPTRPAVHLADHEARLGPLPLAVAPRLADLITAAGLLGRGGGGFPTGRKFRAVAQASSARRPAVVIANCCEGDPTSSKDAVLLTTSPHLVIDGAVLAAAAVGADRVILAVHEGAGTTTGLRRALSERGPGAAGIAIAGVPARFVASESTALVRYLNSGDARPGGRLTAIWESGVDGRPTLVDNAETLAQVALIARFGPDWFTSVGTPDEPGTTLVTVAGAVSRPGVVEIAGGTALRTILAAVGYHPATDPSWALVGGLAGRWIDLTRGADIGFSAAELAAAGGVKGVASIVVLPPHGCVLRETARILDHLAAAGARQCGPCMFGLPAIAADMAGLVAGDRTALGRLRHRLPVINGRGACGHPDGAVALAASALQVMTGPEAVHLDGHLRLARCLAGPPMVPLGGSIDGGRA
ncbi:NADH:ubiquinone oxidoreductase, NADH-binding subunit (chain F) [Nakamurella panacisegetis]|uniref:NADH:ubiquinone oxidoreductase, NADH-binding subunit (Chain F) n=1 Tax=Nakamurella panacisegetis TaxID=1090615 RepID=A0A1H0JVN7_9ACTN|nr:NADH-ubiquinone oxidoreductase-F iron-sulfur binding region domain-containing protein [Nakamurella panacisegetis]SDO47845.1 NADH:ubiquinone oxidoreductase, NADH-binding subunit (chain F) [Nakamurella panacisegetis]